MRLVGCCCDCGFVCVVSFAVLWLRCGLIVVVAVCVLVLGFEFAWCGLFAVRYSVLMVWICLFWLVRLLFCEFVIDLFCLNGCVDDFSGCWFGWMVGF